MFNFSVYYEEKKAEEEEEALCVRGLCIVAAV